MYGEKVDDAVMSLRSCSCFTMLMAACGGAAGGAPGAVNDGSSGAASQRGANGGIDAPTSDDAGTVADSVADIARDDGGRTMSDGPAADADVSSFPGVLYESIWLVGWSGDLDHYRWFRFSPNTAGTAGTWSSAPARCGTCDCRVAPCQPGETGTFTVTLPETLVHPV